MSISSDLRLFLTLLSGVCWTLVYILIIIRSFAQKTYGMPFWALAFNLSWEFIFSAVLIKEPHSIQLIINRVWGTFDLLILVSYFMYGQKDWPLRVSKKLFYPYSLLVLVISYFFVYLLSVEFNDGRGMYSAFIQNLMMSLLFINMFNNRKDLSGQSVGIAFFKMLGTLAPTILYGMKSHFVLFLGTSCFVVDMIYLVLVVGRRRSRNASVLP